VKNNNKLKTSSDVDWKDDIDDCKSRSGNISFLSGTPIS